jgi:phosphoserine phosphatase
VARDAAELLLEYAQIQNPPYLVAGAGLVIAILCGLTFSRLVQNRLDGWKQDRLALLPLTRDHVAELAARILDEGTPSVRRNLRFFREHKGRIVILSGGFREIVAPLAAHRTLTRL